MTGPTAETMIQKLGLFRHPEGGWYRETYRSAENIPGDALPQRFGDHRPFCTSIYFLLKQGDVSSLHRIKSDELWHFHAGSALTVHLLTPLGAHRELHLGSDVSAGESFQAVVPAGCWFGAEVSGAGEFSLVGCTVAPGFDFADFEMGKRRELLQQFPAHAEIIKRLTNNQSAMDSGGI